MLEQIKFRVRWTNHDGQRAERGFYTREQAIRWMNILVLDCGISDAKLHRITFENRPRITFSSNGRNAS